MKLPLQWLLASALLTSVCATGWPYHEIVGVGQSAERVLVAPVYGVAPAVSLLPADHVEETIVAGPVTGTTFVEGSSSGPVSIVSPGEPAPDVVVPSTEKTVDAAGVSDDFVLIKGATAGPVTLIAPSVNHVPDNAPSARPETKKGAVAASAEAMVAIENAEESSTTKVSANATAISETIGVASAKAVIGPSTGPIIIAGPTGPPTPVTASTSAPVTVAMSTASSVSFTSTAVANVSTSSAVDVQENDRPGFSTDATKTSRIEATASSSSSPAQSSVNSIASAKVNLITPGSTLSETTDLSNLLMESAQTIPSTVISSPSATASASAVLLKAPLLST